MSERNDGYIDGLTAALTIIQNVIDAERAVYGHIPRHHIRRRRERDAKLALPELTRMRLTETRDRVLAKTAT